MGGSSKKQTVGYRYFLGMHMILCHGPADKLIRIRVDDKDAYTFESTGGQISINASDLFGGESREGGVSGTVDIEMGKPTQGQNSYLVSKLGSLVPSFRGVVGVVLRQCYLGVNPYLKKWAFRLQRIHVRQNGIVQWYDEKAEIGTVIDNQTISYDTFFDYQILPYIVDTSNPAAVAAIQIPQNGYNSKGRAPFGRAGTGGSLHPVYPINTFWGYNTSLWLRKYIYSDGSNITLSGYVENGAAFYIDGVLVYSVNLHNTQSATSSGIPYTASIAVSAGVHVLHILVLDEDDGPSPGDLNANDNTYFYCQVGALEVSSSYADMNPAHIIRECLTDPDWGMGYQDADIDEVSFKYAADTLFKEGMGVSLLWDRQVAIEEFVKEIVKHIDAALFVDRQSGKFTLKLIRNDYVLADLLVLNTGNVDKIADFTRPAFGELTNSITVNYWDSATGTDASLTVQDIALSQMQGVTINTTVQYPGFTKKSIASRVAQRDLKTLSTPLISCTIYANRDAASLNIGSCFKLTWPDYDLNEVVMRVTGIAYGDGRTNRVRINCSQDVFSLPETSFIPPTPPIWEDPNSDAAPAPYRVVVEAPYYELVQRLGQTNADQQISANNDIGYLIVSAAAPSGAINGRLAVDNGAGYENNDYPMDFCPVGFLTGAIDYDDTVISLTGFVASSSVVLGTHAQIGSELVKITAVASDSITVGRGVLDTVPTLHASGTPVLFWDAFGDSDNVEYVTNETINVKILPTTGRGTLAIASAPEDSLTFASRAYKPYAPGNLKIRSVAYPDAIGGSEEFNASWSHRDRLQQTAGEIYDTAYGNIGPEAGTTYNLKIYGENGNLLRNVTGLSATSYVYNYSEELSESGLYDQIGGSGDALWSNVSFLMLPQGANNSTSFADLSLNNLAITRYGDTKIINPAPTGGPATSAAYFDGTNDYLTLPNNALVNNFGTGDFCIDGWILFTNVSNEFVIIDCGSSWTGSMAYLFEIRAGGDLRFYAGNSVPVSIASGTGVIVANTWHWVEVSRISGVVRMFVDGIKRGTDYTGSAVNISNNSTPFIGTFFDGSSDLPGYIASLRITKGEGRNSANYTKPTGLPIYGYNSATRQNGKLTIELESQRGAYKSFQKHSFAVERSGYGFNYGKRYGN